MIDRVAMKGKLVITPAELQSQTLKELNRNDIGIERNMTTCERINILA